MPPTPFKFLLIQKVAVARIGGKHITECASAGLPSGCETPPFDLSQRIDAQPPEAGIAENNRRPKNAAECVAKSPTRACNY